MDLSACDATEDARKAADQACGCDSSKRFSLAHTEPADAEVEERRAGRLEVETALLHLGEVRDDLREEALLLAAERRETREQLVIGQIGEMHARL